MNNQTKIDLLGSNELSKSTQRFGNFSSSSIHKLTTSDKSGNFGKPALTYIEEIKYEIKLGRKLSNDAWAKELSWGNFLENRAFNMLGEDYHLVSKDRLWHNEIPNWCGAPDTITMLNDSDLNSIGDIKCPFTLKSMCEQVDSFNSIEDYKSVKPEYYWQLVSNAILANVNYAEAIIYVPYEYELKEIKDSIIDTENAKEYAWIYNSNSKSLPYLIKDTYYKNINIFKFKVPQEDIDFLTKRVSMAVELLK
jgi:hypothetical protein